MKTRLYRLAFHWSVTSSLLLITVRYQRVWLQKEKQKIYRRKKETNEDLGLQPFTVEPGLVEPGQADPGNEL